ncbi:MAG: fucose isomerase, partial [Limnochordia bacterium]
DPDRFVLFHCGNFAKEFYDCASCRPVIDYPPILASTLGQENTYGAIDGRMKPGKATFARITTDDLTGTIRAYCAEGQVTDDSLATFGSWGVVKVPGLQKLMRYICENGFEHHVAMSLASVADVLAEALGKYLGWDVYHHA